MVHLSLSILLAATCTLAVTGEYPCKTPADIVLLIDTSTNYMTRQQFEDLLVFAQILLEHFNISRNTVRVGVASFSSDSKLVVGLGKYNTKSEIQDKIINLTGIRNSGGRKDLHTGIQNAREELEIFGRPGVAKIIVILMEGGSHKPKDAVENAKEAMQGNIIITFVNVHYRDKTKSESINQKTLRLENVKKHGEIASPPKEQYLFPVTSFDDLFVIHRPVAQRICEAAEELNMN